MKLSKVKFLDASSAKELSKDEQKLILGGYSDSSCCFYVDNYNNYQCASSPSEAEGSAGGKYGTWACNTDEAKRRCHC